MRQWSQADYRNTLVTGHHVGVQKGPANDRVRPKAAKVRFTGQAEQTSHGRPTTLPTAVVVQALANSRSNGGTAAVHCETAIGWEAGSQAPPYVTGLAVFRGSTI